MRCMKGIIWGKASGGGGCFHIAACLITPVRPRHRPQDDAFLTPITKKKKKTSLPIPLSVFSGGAQTQRHPRDRKLFMHV